MPTSSQPSTPAKIRKRMQQLGARQLSNSELLELLLEAGKRRPRAEAPPPGASFDGEVSFRGYAPKLTNLTLLELQVQDYVRFGIPPRTACQLLAAVELGRRAAHLPRRSAKIECLADVQDWAEGRLVRLSHEEVWVLSLDARNQIKRADRVGQGGVHGCGLNPTDILRPPVKHAASSIVMVHNHPSGDPTPSTADVSMTKLVAQACDLLGVPLLDHVVVAREGACSVAYS
jgi:DNA repair protein RadC